jgi:hypothetical protein
VPLQKVKPMTTTYWMLEDEMEKRAEWWKDKSFTEQLDKEFAAWKDGKEEAYALTDIDNSIRALKQKRKAK